MTTLSSHDLAEWVGHTAVDPRGDKIGKISDIYVDDTTHQPEWLAVKTGMFGGNLTFVPLAGASPEGDDIKLAYEKSLVKDAPNVPAEGHLDQGDEDRLYQHYDFGFGPAGVATDESARQTSAETRTGRSTDDAMTRSEEELDVERRTRETGKARLHKWVETEDVQITVPVKRERARVVTEPITDENRDAAMSGAEISEADHEVTLHEEEIDVSKHAVPKERVRLEKETETEEVAVEEQLRKERIEGETDR